MSCLESSIRFKLQWVIQVARECVCLTDHTVLKLLVFDRENSTRRKKVRWNKMNYNQYQTEIINTLMLAKINDLLTFFRRFPGHVYFRISAWWACEDYRWSNHMSTGHPDAVWFLLYQEPIADCTQSFQIQLRLIIPVIIANWICSW